MTGAAQDQMLAEALESVDAPWPEDIGPQMRAMPAFRAELRNLVARAGEAGMGAAEPVADNETAEGRAQNRRVEIRAQK